MNKEFIAALEQLQEEKGVSKDMLIDAIENALASSYKKNYGASQDVRVTVDRQSGDISVYVTKMVVEDVYDPFTEILVEDAQKIDPELKFEDYVEVIVAPGDFGRIAAQTAKQVVVQRIREAERGMIFDDYSARQGELITGEIQRISNETVFIDMGKTEGILAVSEQVSGEIYKIGNKMKFYIMDVKRTTKGPQVYLSRSHPGLVKRLFELEVPEITDGTVEIKSISREAGSRTKMAVWTGEPNVDAVGSCVGSRGTRVQAVVDELFGEKIDIITWNEDPEKLISSSLSPAKVEKVIVNEEEKSALVIVPDYQLSLAIGKEGQNVRLAAKLCGWKIDIKSHSRFSGADENGFYDDDEAEAEAASPKAADSSAPEEESYLEFYDDEMEEYSEEEPVMYDDASDDDGDYFDGEGYDPEDEDDEIEGFVFIED